MPSNVCNYYVKGFGRIYKYIQRENINPFSWEHDLCFHRASVIQVITSNYIQQVIQAHLGSNEYRTKVYYQFLLAFFWRYVSVWDAWLTN